jgi:hypothetical protein
MFYHIISNPISDSSYIGNSFCAHSRKMVNWPLNLPVLSETLADSCAERFVCRNVYGEKDVKSETKTEGERNENFFHDALTMEKDRL